MYHISLKSHRGEILFQGAVPCSDNLRAARFQRQRLQRSTPMNMHVHSFNNKPFVCTYNVHAHTCIVVDPVPCSDISRVVFNGMS